MIIFKSRTKECIAIHRRWFVLSTAIVIVAGSTLGCDDRPKRVPISGIVMIDGKPVAKGNINFVPEHGRAAAGKIVAGEFELTCYEPGDGAILGTHRVQVSARELKSEEKLVWLAPRKYADFRTSGLTYEVTKPDDSVQIELTWEGEKRSR